MRLVLAVAMAVLPALTAANQDRETLLQACASLQSAEERATCFEALARAAPQAASARDGLVPAFTALSAAISAGTSLANYETLIQPAATETAMLRRSPLTDKEADAVTQLETAIDAYQDAGIFWRADIRFYSKRGNDLAYSGGLPLRLAGVEHLATKWNLPLQKSDMWGIERGIPRKQALSIIWAHAERNAEAALKVLAPAAVQQ